MLWSTEVLKVRSYYISQATFGFVFICGQPHQTPAGSGPGALSLYVTPQAFLSNPFHLVQQLRSAHSPHSCYAGPMSSTHWSIPVTHHYVFIHCGALSKSSHSFIPQIASFLQLGSNMTLSPPLHRSLAIIKELNFPWCDLLGPTQEADI